MEISIDKRQAIRKHPWFENLDEPSLSLLETHSRWLYLAAGDTLFFEGQPAESCFLVHHGSLQGLRHTSFGEEKIFGHIGPGSWVSVLSLFMPQPRHLHDIRASIDTEGCLFEMFAFRRVCDTTPCLACDILSHAASLVAHHTDQIDWLTSSTAEERIAEYILRFGAHASRPGTAILLPLTYSQIAVKLGMRLETLSRILSKWQQQGYIAKQRSQLRMLKPESLQRLAGHRHGANRTV